MSRSVDTAHRQDLVEGPIAAAGPRARWREMRPVLAAVAATLIVGLGLTLLVLRPTIAQTHDKARANFDHLAEQLTTEVQHRVDLPRLALMSARNLFAAGKSVERVEFRTWILSHDSPTEFSRAMGLGFIQRVMRKDLDRFIATERKDRAPNFAVRTSGDAPDLFVVKFVEPLGSNRAALGYDVGSEPIRRAAVEHATSTGEATLTGRITLLQDEQQRAGFLYLLPIYRNGADPKTQQQREAALVGLVYMPIVIDELLADVMDREGDGDKYNDSDDDDKLDVEIFEGRELTQANLLLDLGGPPLASASTTFDGRMFHDVMIVDIGGRDWSLAISTTPTFEVTEVDRTTPKLVGLAGVLLSTLLAMMVWSLGRDRARTLTRAQDLTAESSIANARARNALRETAALLAAIQEHFSVSIADASGRISGVNDSFCRISGYSREELLGQDHNILSSGRHPESFWAQMWWTISSGQPWCGEVCNKARDGSVYWVDSIVAPFQDADGRIEKFISIRSDITERKNTEEELARNNDLLHRTGEMAKIGGWELDLPSRQLTWSEETYRIHEVEPDTPVTLEQAVAFYLPEARQRIAEAVQVGIDQGQAWDLELPLLTARGKTIWVRAKGEAVVRDGAVVKLHGAFQDVTLQYLAREELARRAVEMELLRDKADAANRAKSEFLANMSHEIRTPLTAILGYTDLLRDDGDLGKAPPSRLETIDTIASAGQHLLAVINNLLDLSKIEADRMNVESIETKLVALLAEDESIMRLRSTDKGITFTVALATPLPDRVMTDPTRLRQILMNLTGNATKFTQQGSVCVTARVEGPSTAARLVIEVEDTGPGIAPALAEKLFAPFSQADTSVARQHGGTGLGLTIARRLARLMGGDVTLAWTELGQGSRFRLELPLVPAAGAAKVSSLENLHAKPRTSAASNAAALSGRILLAEDSLVNQRLILFHLRKAGAEADVAENGLIALEMLDEAAANGRPYDLLLTDMQMPEMDGYELARSLRQRGSTLPIIALTAHAMAEDRQKCIDAGCNDYASKPIHKAALLEACGKWIGKAVGPHAEQAAW